MKKTLMMATVAFGLALAGASQAQVLGGSGGLTGGLGGNLGGQVGGLTGGVGGNGSLTGGLTGAVDGSRLRDRTTRSEEHTSELQSRA